MSDRDDLAAELRATATALERASAHCLIAAAHLDDGLHARTGAHAFAARGDIVTALAALDAAAVNFAAHASTE